MKIKPQCSYTLIEILPREAETSKGGITIPEQAIRFQQPIGIVRAVGEHVTNVVAGMKVIITSGGFKHSHEGKDYVLLQSSEILASVDE